jgi:hypothetical protein
MNEPFEDPLQAELQLTASQLVCLDEEPLQGLVNRY